MSALGGGGCIPRMSPTQNLEHMIVSRTEQPLSMFLGAWAHPYHTWGNRLGLGVSIWGEKARIRADRFALPQASLLLAQPLVQVLPSPSPLPSTLSRALQIDKAAS